jgi:SpoVK/Ycf46/Vps4 family AAA+-type ATPase
MEVESRCTVLFFDEIDALGMSRSESSGGSADVGGSDNSSRRVLAELLIQLSKLAHQNEHDITESQHSNLQDCGRLGPFYEAHNMGHQRTDDDLQGASMVDAFASAGAGSNEHQNQSNETIGPMQTDEIYPQARLLVIAATNRPEDCDPALLRRFAIRMLVGLPTFRDRKRIFRRLLTNIDHCIKSHELNQLAEATEEYSGSDLESLAREACMAPIRECLRKAAIHKAKNRKKEQKSGEDCTQENKRPTSKASDESVKEMLLNGLGSLRPVSMDDFELAVSFWVGDYQHTVGYGNRDKTQNRYDSDSSSDEDE